MHKMVGGGCDDAVGDDGGYDPLDKATKGKRPLAATSRDCAVSVQVVERLHDASRRVQSALRSPMYVECSHLFGGQPEAVRRDLQRVAVSNLAVDATGEAKRTRTTVPPPRPPRWRVGSWRLYVSSSCN